MDENTPETKPLVSRDILYYVNSNEPVQEGLEWETQGSGKWLNYGWFETNYKPNLAYTNGGLSFSAEIIRCDIYINQGIDLRSVYWHIKYLRVTVKERANRRWNKKRRNR